MRTPPPNFTAASPNIIGVDSRILIDAVDRLNATMEGVQRIMARLDTPTPPTPQRELMDVSEVAMLIGMSERFVEQVGNSGRNGFPKPIKVGRRTKWRRRDVQKWIDAQPAA